jgi:hypothetical protein
MRSWICFVRRCAQHVRKSATVRSARSFANDTARSTHEDPFAPRAVYLGGFCSIDAPLLRKVTDGLRAGRAGSSLGESGVSDMSSDFQSVGDLHEAGDHLEVGTANSAARDEVAVPLSDPRV